MVNEKDDLKQKVEGTKADYYRDFINKHNKHLKKSIKKQ